MNDKAANDDTPDDAVPTDERLLRLRVLQALVEWLLAERFRHPALYPDEWRERALPEVFTTLEHFLSSADLPRGRQLADEILSAAATAAIDDKPLPDGRSPFP